MRRRDPVRIGDALNDFFSSTPVIARKIAEAKIPDLWPVLVGNVIASYTTKIELRTGGRLFVHLSSSVARNEVFMRRSALMDAINEASGIRIVSSVIVKELSARTQNAMPFGPRSAPRGRGSSAVKNGPCRKERSCTVRKRSAGTGPCPKACPESCRPYHFSCMREL